MQEKNDFIQTVWLFYKSNNIQYLKYIKKIDTNWYVNPKITINIIIISLMK